MFRPMCGRAQVMLIGDGQDGPGRSIRPAPSRCKAASISAARCREGALWSRDYPVTAGDARGHKPNGRPTSRRPAELNNRRFFGTLWASLETGENLRIVQSGQRDGIQTIKNASRLHPASRRSNGATCRAVGIFLQDQRRRRKLSPARDACDAL